MVNAKKVIWIINQYAGSSKHGMTFRSYFLAKQFIKKYEVNIFSASFSHVMSNPPEVLKNTTENIDGITYHWIKVFKYTKSKSISRVISMFLFLFKLFFYSTSKFKKPDVIIVSSISPLPIWKAYLWSKKYKAKLIFEVRDIWPLSLIEIGGFKNSHPFIWLLQKTEDFAYKVSDYVVSVLPYAFDHMKNHGLNIERFRYIPNGIEINEESVKVYNNKVFKVGYAGTIGIANALDYLIHTSNILKNENIEFHLLGNGPEKSRLIKLVESLGIKNVFFYKSVSKDQVPNFLCKMDALFIGWHKSNLYRFGISPNKIFDYLLSSRPIINSSGAKNKIIKEAKAGFSVEPEDPKAIAEAILKLSKMTLEQRIELGKNGRNYVEKYHSYKKLAIQYESLF
jgi:glycosyltransferase involved in cell wall biosynthesis